MEALDIDTITQLLKEGSSSTKTSKPGKFARPIQLGPLRYYDQTFRCTRKRCMAPTCIKINDAPYCNTHALYALNQLLMKSQELDWVNNECDCETGKYSMGCMHNDLCSTFDRLKEQRDNGSI